MKTSKPSMYSIVPWSLAACGFLVVLGNLLGLTGLQIPIFPVVNNLPGLLVNSILLTAIGFIPVAISYLFQKS